VSAIALIYYLIGVMTYDGRLAAFYGSPNYLAMFLAPGIFLGIYFFIENFNRPHPCPKCFAYRSRRARPPLPTGEGGEREPKTILLSLSVLTILTAIYFTYSYATWLSVILSFIVILAWKKIKYPTN